MKAERTCRPAVRTIFLADRTKELKNKNIVLETKNHPTVYDEASQVSWRAKLIEIVLEIERG